MHTRFRFCRNIAYEDRKQASLFAPREALIHAKKSGWVVRMIRKNRKLLNQTIDTKAEGVNWRYRPLVEDIKRLGNVCYEEEGLEMTTQLNEENSRCSTFASNFHTNVVLNNKFIMNNSL
ncbi:hypothetical protein E1A91_A09G237300v1 [Gossypium mustelinum]|uniref:Uncharacterized protein n=1 Tax=Gossypium mustelinum TaxID=34275 RepID=A0A5D2Y1H0_GOSMU|nr:hypothetical protein E1A91_A09G237300v1 [Gossypium mustelinum]